MQTQLVDDFILKTHMQKQSISGRAWRAITGYASVGIMLLMAFGIMAVMGLLGYAFVLIFLG
jgi:ABC-type Na+ efflux pump permease subunit